MYIRRVCTQRRPSYACPSLQSLRSFLRSFCPFFLSLFLSFFLFSSARSPRRFQQQLSKCMSTCRAENSIQSEFFLSSMLQEREREREERKISAYADHRQSRLRLRKFSRCHCHGHYPLDSLHLLCVRFTISSVRSFIHSFIRCLDDSLEGLFFRNRRKNLRP